MNHLSAKKENCCESEPTFYKGNEEHSMIVTTAPILQGYELSYIGYVSVRNVRAINIFRDFFTSFRDVIGGRSLSYETLMKNMEKEVLLELQEKAKEMHANGVIAVDVDFDNISSKGKSLIMCYAHGTAVYIKSQVAEKYK